MAEGAAHEARQPPAEPPVRRDAEAAGRRGARRRREDAGGAEERPGEEQIYKYVGSLLVKVTKEDITKELEEKKDISNTRTLVLNKQETRLKDNIKELQTKIDDMIKGRTQGSAAGFVQGS